MIDRYGRLFATRGRDNAAVAQRYLQGLTQAARGTPQSQSIKKIA